MNELPDGADDGGIPVPGSVPPTGGNGRQRHLTVRRRGVLTLVGVCALVGCVSAAAAASVGASHVASIAQAAAAASPESVPASSTASAAPSAPRSATPTETATAAPMATAAATATPSAPTTQGNASPAPPVRRTPVPARPLPTVSPSRSAFVGRSGANLVLNGHVWQFVGYDDYRLTSVPNALDCGGVTTDSDLNAMLTEIQANSGATVIRTWFNQSFGGPGNWAAFDRVLAAAAAHGMKVIPSLTDQWSACEPSFPTTHYRPLAWYQSGYKSPDAGYALPFRTFAVDMAAHYAGNTTIAFWQLVNEPEAKDSINGSCEEQTAAAALRGFIDDVTGAMKAVDPNHLVDPGSIGSGQCGMSGPDYSYVHAGLADICELHDYSGPGAIPGDQWNGVALRISECDALGKPIYEGEVGVTATGTGLVSRAQAYAAKMNAQFARGLAGFAVWEWAPPGTTSQAYEVAPGDPLEPLMKGIITALNNKNGT